MRQRRWSCSRHLRLRQAEWVVVHTRSGPLGVAAYHDTPCDIRVVQEFVLDPALDTGYSSGGSVDGMERSDGVLALTRN